MARNVLKSSLQNASFSIMFQIVFRLVTFVLNAFVIRHVGQNVLGIMNVRLLLLESTVLFLCKEPLLKACLTDTKSHNWAQVINQIWMSVPVCGLLGGSLVYVWIHWLSPADDLYLTQYRLGCYTIAVSCVVDQIAQNFVLVAQSYCFVKLKVVMDTIHVVLRTIIFVSIIVYEPQQAINAFSVAQIVSSLVNCLGFGVFFWWYIRALNAYRLEDVKRPADTFRDMADFRFRSVREFLPGVMHNEDGRLLNRGLCVLTVSFVKQCVVKQILTEGERYVMTLSPVLTFSQQSMYDIVNNLGSLAARFIFRPIEESSYFYFTQMLKRDENIKQQEKKNVAEAVTVLSQLCRVVSSIGLVAIVFGQSYSATLLYLYGGEVLTADGLPTLLLKCHCIAVLLLAVNGVTECYVFATMDSTELDRYNYLMVVFSVSFLVVSYLLTNVLGPVGFIIANCLNMTARIVHSLRYIGASYRDTGYRPLDGLRPSGRFLLVLACAGLVTKSSEDYFFGRSVLAHVAVGGVCFLGTVTFWMHENRELVRDSIDKFKRRASVKRD